MGNIENSVIKIKNTLEKKGVAIMEEHAFSYFIINTYYKDGVDFEDIYYSIKKSLTDGPNDGGIDFVFYDENESKVILGQSKYSETISLEQAKTEFVKMNKTVKEYREQNVGAYNSDMIQQLANSLGFLDDEYPDKIEYLLYTTAKNITTEAFESKYSGDPGLPPLGSYQIINGSEIEDFMSSMGTQSKLVNEYKIDIDDKDNYLVYSNSKTKGVLVNISSRSIFEMYNNFHNCGLFDLNIRKYVKNEMVDNKINNTLEKERENFWFLNNGLTIACEDYSFDGKKIKLYKFSIVNGGQTTTLIGRYSGKQTSEFWVLCKIVAPEDKTDASEFIAKIAEASNSQKAILIRDLRSNSFEMKKLKNLLGKYNVHLEIKRGEDKEPNKQIIKNDEFGQLFLSFVYQQPGTSRTNKRFIFEKQDIYEKIFKLKIANDLEDDFGFFVKDLVDLRLKYREQIKKLQGQNKFNSEESDTLSNGEQAMFALFGIIYALVNKVIKVDDFNKTPQIVKDMKLSFKPHISNYKADDFEEKLSRIITKLIKRMTKSYKEAFKDGKVKNVTNYFKPDQNYYDMISSVICDIYLYDDEFIENFDIFKWK